MRASECNVPLEKIRPLHGPCDLLANYFEFADAAARERGVRLSVSTDFDRLVAINKRQAANWSTLSPIFDPNKSRLTPNTAFWVEGIDEFGETVLTSAGRLYDHEERSLADDFRSLHVFYDDPAPRRDAGETVGVDAPAAERVRGRAMFSGAVWVRPDHRRHGFSRIIPRLARGYALTRWNCALFWGLIKPDLDKIGLTQAYGSWQMGGRLAIHMPSWRSDFELFFLWMTRDTLVEDIASACAHETGASARRIEIPITNVSLPERHGISTRS
jgi:GNAT superfamily N-acetyltransferase